MHHGQAIDVVNTLGGRKWQEENQTRSMKDT